MSFLLVKPVSCLEGKINLAGDKSISHRSVILSAISQGKTEIRNFSFSNDCLATIGAFRKLGIKIVARHKRASLGSVSIYGQGLHGLKAPKNPIYVGESGTTLRLLLGVLAGQNFKCTITAGKSLNRRPMRRVTLPLRLMGAIIKSKIKNPCLAGRQENSKIEEYPPITIQGGRLKAISYKMPVASAQVKSAILLAGIYAVGKTKVIEVARTRDHTERMLKLFGADLNIKDCSVWISGQTRLASPGKISIPGDISAAAFFIVAATLIRGSKITIKSVSLNPTRLGLLRVLKRMGAKIQIKELKSKNSDFEPMGDIIIESSALKGTVVKRREIPSLIDELPILMVAASVAKGRTIIDGAEELRVKETDRINSMVTNLRRMGVSVNVSGRHRGKITIQGIKRLKAATVDSFGDHRTAMSIVVAAIAAEGLTRINGIECIKKSFPDFVKVITSLFR